MEKETDIGAKRVAQYGIRGAFKNLNNELGYFKSISKKKNEAGCM